MAKKKAPEAPVTDERIQAELKALVELGKKKGFLTHDDILEQFPEAEQNIELIDRVYSVLLDRKSTRLNSSHVAISYAVFCLQKKNGCRTDVCLVLLLVALG